MSRSIRLSLNDLSWAFDHEQKIANYKPRLKNIHGMEFIEDSDKAIYPFFTEKLLARVNAKRAVNILVVGEAGIGKSYTANQACRNIYRRFCIELVVYGLSNYYDALQLKRYGFGAPIHMDEPQWAIDHRDWYQEPQKAIIKTIESQRNMVRPLFVSIISPALIDKTVRDYLVQFQVECFDRGKARVFELQVNQRESKTYYHFLCNLDYGMMDQDLCDEFYPEHPDSCIDCDKLEECHIFKADYEKKKKSVQAIKFKQYQEEAVKQETKEMSLDQILEKAYSLSKHYTTQKHIDVNRLRVVLSENKIKIGHNKAYDLRTLLEYRYPEDFEGKE